MTGIKRKRVDASAPRKNAKLEASDGSSSVGASGEDDRMLSDESGSASGQESDEEEEWGGIGANNGPLNPVVAVVDEARRGTKPNKPPTGHELRVIKDAADLFQSNSFKLQIDALLPNVRPKASRLPPLDRYLLFLHKFLNGLASKSPLHPLEASRKLLKRGIAVPYPLPLPSEDTNWKVAFEKPSDITLVGSWANKVSVKSKDSAKFGVDLAVEMPDRLFQEKDYLNGRFFHKRAFYLACLAEAIKQHSSQLHVDVGFESFGDDPRLTKLVLVPHSKGSLNDFTKLNARICVIPVLSATSPISLHRLSPSHSNIRVSSTLEEENNKSKQACTPLYNTALLMASSVKSHLLTVHALKNESDAFADALTLLRVWSNQRGYGEGNHMSIRGFPGRGFWWSALLGYLILGEEPRGGSSKKGKRKPLGRGLSSYQLYRACLDFLAKHDFKKEPVFMKTQNGHLFPPEEYQQADGPIFLDSSSRVNILAGIPFGSLELLQHDAKMTLEALAHNSLSGDAFTEVFIKDHRNVLTKFDTVLRVDLSAAKPRELAPHAVLDRGSAPNAVMAAMDALLHQALGNRSKAVTLLHTPSGQRPVSQAHPTNPDVIYIGLIHDHQHAFRLVDHGPAADEDDQDAIARFRDLWGQKAELRRFKDGRIMESVVWEVKTIDERAHIPSMVARHILQLHFGLGPESVQTWQRSFDSVLRLPESISSLYSGSGVATGFKGAITAFDLLVKNIKALGDELPLGLTTVSSISECLRYTSVFSPVPLPASISSLLPPNARYRTPIDIILEFEKSSKWPDDLHAVQKIKLAFFERIASSLMAAINGIKASVVVGEGVCISEITDRSFLEIITPEGWVFWAHIWHDREITLLDRIIDNRGGVLPHITIKAEDRKRDKHYQEAVVAKEILTRRFIHGPRHHRAIAALAHQYSAFAGTVRLVKRWLASHWLLQGHISDEVVELLCAKLFLGDGKNRSDSDDDENIRQPYASVPASKERGFARVVEFLKDWTWEDGLHVPLYGASSLVGGDARTGVATGSQTSAVWTVSTEVDNMGHMWTSSGPDIVVAHRVRALAHGTWEYLQGIEKGDFDVKAMFVHPTDDYDFLVRLDRTVLPRYLHNILADGASLLKQIHHKKPTPGQTVDLFPGFDPARILFNDLQRVYTHTFKLFYDPFGGDCYGGVWDPSLKQPRPFRVLGQFSCLPNKKNDKAKNKDMVSLNKESILVEIERLGQGLISEVTINV